ncbi:MAG: TIGR03986 family CRISPR-associated RAMP protein [Acidobacteriota bacterium]|nr:MAG: TIGR03986 family CRISPR-associated RAMP protein [Acidobacteriota bacterium]
MSNTTETHAVNVESNQADDTHSQATQSNAQPSMSVNPSPATGKGFINPYNFVRVAPFHPRKDELRSHEKFAGLSGRIVCQIKNVTPLCLPDAEASQEFVISSGINQGKKRWRKDFSGLVESEPYLPGSSIKGMLRSIVEAASNSCFSIFVKEKDRAVFRDNRKFSTENRRLGRLIRKDDKWAMRDIHPDDWNPPTNPNDLRVIWKKRRELYADEPKRGNLFPDREIHNPEPVVIEDNQEPFEFEDNRYNSTFHWQKLLRGLFGDTERRDFDRNGKRYRVIRDARGRVTKDDRPDHTRRVGKPVFVLWPVADENEERNAQLYDVEQSTIDQYRNMVESNKFRRFHDESVRLEDWQEQYLEAKEDEIYWYRRHGRAKDKVTEFGRNFRYKWAYNPREALRGAFHPCKDPYQACPCCDIFGMVDEDAKDNVKGEVKARAGKISISPARFAGGTKEFFWIDDPRILGEPKYSCRSFYLDPDDKNFLSPDCPTAPEPPNTSKDEFVSVRRKDNGEVEVVRNAIRGRKFYWHHTAAARQFQTKEEWQQYVNRRDKQITQNNRDKRPPETDQNARLQAMMPGARFEFSIDFENLSAWQLGLLLWTLALPDVENGAHHLGLGKPIGLGTVEISIRQVQLIDRGKRYASLFATGIAVDMQADLTNTDDKIDIDGEASPFREYVNAFRATMERWHKEERQEEKPFLELENIADLRVILSLNQPSHATPPEYMESIATGNVPIMYPPGTGAAPQTDEPHPEELHHKWFGAKNWSEPLLSVRQIAIGFRQRRAN